jgi:hypothetical protein
VRKINANKAQKKVNKTFAMQTVKFSAFLVSQNAISLSVFRFIIRSLVLRSSPHCFGKFTQKFPQSTQEKN